MNYLVTIILLTCSNTFMTIAWYGHLRYDRTKPLWLLVLASWGIAFLEYCFQVPANRYGYLRGLSPGVLKVIQEAITLVVFAIFARTCLHERLAWNCYVGFACFVLGVFFVFYFRHARNLSG